MSAIPHGNPSPRPFPLGQRVELMPHAWANVSNPASVPAALYVRGYTREGLVELEDARGRMAGNWFQSSLRRWRLRLATGGE